MAKSAINPSVWLRIDNARSPEPLEGRSRTIKNQKYIFLASFFVLGLLAYDYSYAQAVSSVELINRAGQYDGKIILFEGEVIGDIMVRGGHAWVNVSDGDTAIGIWADKELIAGITYSGGYNSKGDWIGISGIFSRACGEHSGELDIHAKSINILNRGRVIAERPNLEKRNIALVLLGALCLVLILRAFIRILIPRSK